MNVKEYRLTILRFITSGLYDLVRSEFLTEWQAGMIFGSFNSQLVNNSFNNDDDIFCYEDNFSNHRYKKGDYDGIKSKN